LQQNGGFGAADLLIHMHSSGQPACIGDGIAKASRAASFTARLTSEDDGRLYRGGKRVVAHIARKQDTGKWQRVAAIEGIALSADKAATTDR
jgi:hypothetical protein